VHIYATFRSPLIALAGTLQHQNA